MQERKRTAAPRPTVRKPGHAYQENELYDVFLPIVGHYSTMVWTMLTRMAYGADVSVSLRELAARTGLSKDTVARSISVLRTVNMIEQLTVGKYRLIDLKVLVMDLGGTYSRTKASYELPVAQSDRLRQEAELVWEAGLRKGVAQSDRRSGAKTCANAEDHGSFPQNCERQSRTVGATKVSVLQDTPLYSNTQNNKTSPHTPQRGAEVETVNAFLSDETARRQMWHRVQRAVRDAIYAKQRRPLRDGDYEKFRFDELGLADAIQTRSGLILRVRSPDVALTKQGFAAYFALWTQTAATMIGQSVLFQVEAEGARDIAS